MPGQIQYNYEPIGRTHDPIDRTAIADYLTNDYYNPAPQGGVPLPPRRPIDTYGHSAGLTYDPGYSPSEQRQLNALYQEQSWDERFRNLVPAAMQAYISTRLYPNDYRYITEKNFGPSEANALRQDFDRRASSYYTGGFGTNPLQGFQRGPVADVSQFVPYDASNPQHVRPYVNYSQTVAPNVQQAGPESMLQGIAPFTRGAYYQETPEGIRMRNTYTSPFGQRDVNVLLPMEPR